MAGEVFISETNCITSMGFDVAANIDHIVNGIGGIKLHNDVSKMDVPFYASVIEDNAIDNAFAEISVSGKYTRLEKMLILALYPVVKNSGLASKDSESALRARIGFILSTTKGNIKALADTTADSVEKAELPRLGRAISGFFGFKAEPIVVSNACVSGVLAISVAKKLIRADIYDHVFVVAGDEVSRFVLSGFNSFQAMSDVPCKPFSKDRNGVTLGEAAAAALVTTDKEKAKVKILGDGAINDANHISGPSRTGEGLYRSIKSAVEEADIRPDQLDYISAHGTATPFNDEMEAIAFNRLGLQNIPVNSLKGYYGHTLGASGLLETIIGIEAAMENKLLPSFGFEELGVSQYINIIEKTESKDIRFFLKTASGFGGCNAAMVFEKL